MWPFHVCTVFLGSLLLNYIEIVLGLKHHPKYILKWIDYVKDAHNLLLCPVADPGGGSRGSGPPPFGPRCRLFNIGPKVGPPPFVNVQEWGVFQIF